MKTIPVITYIGGYWARKALRNLKCEDSRSILLDREMPKSDDHRLTQSLDRGGLFFPTPFVATPVMYRVIAVNNSLGLDTFLHERNQKQVTRIALFSVLPEFDDEICTGGHTPDKLVRALLDCAVNVALNNVCKTKNNIDQEKKIFKNLQEERKAKCLSKQ